MVVGGDQGDVGTVLGDGTGPNNSVIALLMRLMRDPQPDVRAMATTTLGYTNSSAPAVIAEYGETLRDPDSNTRRAAADALFACAQTPSPRAPALRAIWEENKVKTALKDRDGEADNAFVYDIYLDLAMQARSPQARRRCLRRGSQRLPSSSSGRRCGPAFRQPATPNRLVPSFRAV